MTLPHLDYEIELWKKGFNVIGIDEVGRGAFAGPVCVGGVIFKPTADKKRLLELVSYGINDSKKLTPQKRKLLAKIIRNECLASQISTIHVAQINYYGIGKATFSAMRDVVKNLRETLHSSKETVFASEPARIAMQRVAGGAKQSILRNEIAAGFSNPRNDTKTFVLVDGFNIKNLPGFGLKNQKAIIHGDGISLSIAAASIIAKVYRDKLMEGLSEKFTNYNWAQNKGYGTLFHRQAIQKFGPTPLHRLAFIRNV